MSRLASLFLALFVAPFALAAPNDQKVTVQVFYESLCPDSQEFIVYQLAPIWPKIKDSVDLELVPFGKSNSTTKTFHCQHGPKECHDNMYQSCVLFFLEPGTQQLDFVNCYMPHPDEYQSCVSMAGLKQKSIDDCLSTQMGRTLQLKAEDVTKRTLRYPKVVPTVVFNKVYKEEDQTDINNRRFTTALCRYATQGLKEFCNP